MAMKFLVMVSVEAIKLGCTDDCQTIEEGYECIVPGTLCRKICGNGYQNDTEQCDDKNEIDNDGCTNCKVDEFYKCREWGMTWYDY